MLKILLILALAAPAYGQTRGQKAADVISTGLVGVNMAADAIYSYKHHCLKQYLYKNLLTFGAAETTKLIVPEDRPDHSDMQSFYSMHSAFAAANTGWNFKLGFSVALGAGAGRIVAKKHHLGDVVVGLAVGIGSTYIFPCTP